MRFDCPSSPPEIATNVLGVFGKERTLRFLPFKVVPLPSSDQDSAVRYTTPCIGSGCLHWVGKACEWPAAVMANLRTNEDRLKYVNCNIVATCRWRHQTEGAACGPCDQVHGAMVSTSKDA